MEGDFTTVPGTVALHTPSPGSLTHSLQTPRTPNNGSRD